MIAIITTVTITYACVCYTNTVVTVITQHHIVQHNIMDSLRGSSVNIGTTQRRLAWPLRKDDTHTHTNREV